MRATIRQAASVRRGTVLIVAMGIILVLVGLVLVFGRTARTEALVSANRVSSVQAGEIARGALQYVLRHLDGADGEIPSDEEMLCEAVEVGDGYFWLLGPSLDDDQTLRYRLVDENSKINLNNAPEEMLLNLPGMTQELAAAIVDWRDADSEITEGGAESEYYLLLEDPYYCKDAPFETVEELLLVKEADYDVFFGEDANRNGVLDPNENDADESDPADNRDGRLDAGLWDYVTVYGSEPNTSAHGQERVNVNDADTGPLGDLLQGVVPDDRYYQVMESARRNRQYDSIIQFYYRVGLEYEEFAQVADRLTTTDDEELTGRVNINTASAEVLRCLPGLEESDVDALLQARPQSAAAAEGVAWVVEALDEEKAEGIGSYITSRSYQFSTDIVATTADGRGYRRVRVVLDARESPPRVLYWQDLTHLGWPLDYELRASLRRGEGIEAALSASG